MKYDFDAVIDRHNTSSLKWDVKRDVLPMWVADMDFKTAPEITDALVLKASSGVYGYSIVPDSWYQAYIQFFHKRYSFDIEKDWLVFSSGVVPTISSCVRKLTTPGEKVLLLTPVYNIFYNSIVNNGRFPLEEELVYDGKEYHIDFLSLEEKMKDPQCSFMILCNPENPTGKVFSKEELARIGEMAAKHGITVLSDEIHGFITRPGVNYVPFASVSETNRRISVTAVSPTKAFNLAGLQTSAVIVPDPFLRHKVWRQINTDEVGEPNFFAITAAVTAFHKGETWLDEMRDYVFANRDYAEKYIEDEISPLSLVNGDATYLLWIDTRKVSEDAKDLTDFLLKDTGLMVTEGEVYGKGGKHFLRMNIACPRKTLLDGLNRLKKGVEDYLK